MRISSSEIADILERHGVSGDAGALQDAYRKRLGQRLMARDAARALAAAIAAGGWIVIAVVLVICLVGLLLASPFGSFFTDESAGPDTLSPSAAMARLNTELDEKLSEMQASGGYDRLEVEGGPPGWTEVFSVFAAKTAAGPDARPVSILDEENMERLRTVFWDMTKLTTAESEVEHPASGDAEAWTETILTVTITPRTPDDMRVFYSFDGEQNAMLDELLTAESFEVWEELLAGSSGEIVSVALSQVGNRGGQPYWSWYGFPSRVSWCACFVSWCANECGYIDAGVIPKFAACVQGSQWFKNEDLWRGKTYTPRPGDVIFFDWDNLGSSGPQDGIPDHVGLVERVENGVVYTIEGNAGDRCIQTSYPVGHYEIYGYGTPNY